MKTVHIIRTRHLARGRIWVVFDVNHTIYGNKRESRVSVLTRWIEEHGKPEDLVRFKGVCRWSEACMTIGSVKNGDA